MELTSLGRSVKGREIWMVTLHERAPENSAAVLATSDSLPAAPAKRLFCLCRQHGHEPASTEAALSFIRDLVKAGADAPLIDDLRRVTVSVVPMANPDGAEAFLRRNAHDVDTNRDWLRRSQPETRAWYHAIRALHPDLMTDQHELYPDDPRPDFTETAGIGSGASPSLIASCNGTQTVVQAAMGAEGFSVVNHTITDRHPARLAHRYGCVVAGVPTLLFETSRFAGSGRDVASRARAHYQFLVTVLRGLAGEGPHTLAQAEARRSGERDMLLASRRKPYRRPGSASAPDSPAAGPAAGTGLSSPPQAHPVPNGARNGE